MKKWWTNEKNEYLNKHNHRFTGFWLVMSQNTTKKSLSLGVCKSLEKRAYFYLKSFYCYCKCFKICHFYSMNNIIIIISIIKHKCILIESLNLTDFLHKIQNNQCWNDDVLQWIHDWCVGFREQCLFLIVFGFKTSCQRQRILFLFRGRHILFFLVLFVIVCLLCIDLKVNRLNRFSKFCSLPFWRNTVKGYTQGWVLTKMF